MQFGHEQLDVYRVSIRYVAWAYETAKRLKGIDRHARDQLLRASQSIPLNIAEGNGKGANQRRSAPLLGNRSRFGVGMRIDPGLSGSLRSADCS